MRERDAESAQELGQVRAPATAVCAVISASRRLYLTASANLQYCGIKSNTMLGYQFPDADGQTSSQIWSSADGARWMLEVPSEGRTTRRRI